jgi:Arc/MetJ-type ribon-helix-helix transcriptional regulator
MRRQTVQLVLDQRHIDWLHDAKERTNKSMSELVRDALEDLARKQHAPIAPQAADQQAREA